MERDVCNFLDFIGKPMDGVDLCFDLAANEGEDKRRNKRQKFSSSGWYRSSDEHEDEWILEDDISR